MSEDTIQFEGNIDNGDAQSFLGQLDLRVKRILVTLEGGFSVEAQKIGDIIEANSLEVAIEEYCMSAGANSLFLRAKTEMSILEPYASLTECMVSRSKSNSKGDSFTPQNDERRHGMSESGWPYQAWCERHPWGIA